MLTAITIVPEEWTARLENSEAIREQFRTQNYPHDKYLIYKTINLFIPIYTQSSSLNGKNLVEESLPSLDSGVLHRVQYKHTLNVDCIMN